MEVLQMYSILNFISLLVRSSTTARFLQFGKPTSNPNITEVTQYMSLRISIESMNDIVGPKVLPTSILIYGDQSHLPLLCYFRYSVTPTTIN